jgi:hypothetical protein
MKGYRYWVPAIVVIEAIAAYSLATGEVASAAELVLGAIGLLYLAWVLQSVLRIVVALCRLAVNWLVTGWEGD